MYVEVAVETQTKIWLLHPKSPNIYWFCCISTFFHWQHLTSEFWMRFFGCDETKFFLRKKTSKNLNSHSNGKYNFIDKIKWNVELVLIFFFSISLYLVCEKSSSWSYFDLSTSMSLQACQCYFIYAPNIL